MSINKLIIIGASSPTIIRIIDDINLYGNDQFDIIGFIDNDVEKHGKQYMSYNILGGNDAIKDYDKNEIVLINTIAKNTSSRKETTTYFEGLGYRFTNIVHPSVNLRYVKLGKGVYIQENVILQPNSVISDHVILSCNSTVAHDSFVDKYVFIGPSAYVCGRVNIGEMSYLSVGAKILPELKIGKNCIIAAGAVVTKDVPSDQVWAGNPAKFLMTKNEYQLKGDENE